jgi:hypothetical protein
MMELTLSALELRVLGSLIEKGLTTPEYYPLTLNALRNACNQKSNRNPVMDLDDDAVFDGLSSLREKGLVESVYADGSRAERYRHLFSTKVPVDQRQMAVLCELFLRGPQTAGELHSRARRMASLGSLGEVHDVLDSLAAFERGAMVEKLPRKPGQKDNRWTHLLSDESESPPESDSAESERTVLLKKTDDERIQHLEQQVAGLRRELTLVNERLEGLRLHVDTLSRQLDANGGQE